jgi:hypothetical protein
MRVLVDEQLECVLSLLAFVEKTSTPTDADPQRLVQSSS